MTGFAVYTRPATRNDPDQTWTANGSTRLAELVQTTCQVSQFDAERLVGAMFDHDPREAAFTTRSMLFSPELSKNPIEGPPVIWRISQTTEHGPGGGRFKLEMWDNREVG